MPVYNTSMPSAMKNFAPEAAEARSAVTSSFGHAAIVTSWAYELKGNTGSLSSTHSYGQTGSFGSPPGCLSQGLSTITANNAYYYNVGASWQTVGYNSIDGISTGFTLTPNDSIAFSASIAYSCEPICKTGGKWWEFSVFLQQGLANTEFQLYPSQAYTGVAGYNALAQSVYPSTAASPTVIPTTGSYRLKLKTHKMFRGSAVGRNSSYTFWDDVKFDVIKKVKDFNSSVVGSDSAAFSWGDEYGEDYYAIYRSTDDATNFVSVGATAMDGTNAVVSDLRPGTTYFYEIAGATDAQPYGNHSNDTWFETLATMPFAPTYSGVQKDFVQIDWVTQDYTPFYEVWKSTADPNNFVQVAGPLDAAVTSAYGDGGLSPASTYYYRLVASNRSGGRTTGPYSYVLTRLNPVIWDVPAVSAVTESGMNTHWLATAGLNSFDVHYSTDSYANFAVVATGLPATSVAYSGSGLLQGTTYQWRVIGWNGAHNMSETSSVEPYQTRFSAVSGVTQDYTGHESVTINWAAKTGGLGATPTAYAYLRRRGSRFRNILQRGYG